MKPLREVQPPFIYAEDLQTAYEELQRLDKVFGEGVETDQIPGGLMIRVPQKPREIVARVYRVQSCLGSGNSGNMPGSGGGPAYPTNPMYRWVEQQDIPFGNYEDKVLGLTGSPGIMTFCLSGSSSGAASGGTVGGTDIFIDPAPAWERNARICPDGSVVVLREGAKYLFGIPGLSGANAFVYAQDWIFDWPAGRVNGSGSSGSGGAPCLTGTMTCPDGSTAPFTLCLSP